MLLDWLEQCPQIRLPRKYVCFFFIIQMNHLRTLTFDCQEVGLLGGGDPYARGGGGGRRFFRQLLKPAWKLYPPPLIFAKWSCSIHAKCAKKIRTLLTYLIFVIFLHRQNFWRRKFTPKNANFSPISANLHWNLHRKMPIFANLCQFFALNL